MRQAGRYLPIYRKVKGTMPITTLAKDPELASQVVVDAVEALGVDAGIIFADIMLPLEGLGVQFTIEENVGPVLKNPVRTSQDINLLGSLDPEGHMAYLFDGINATIKKLDGKVPLIGFSGAPFTLAGYIIEGRPSKDMENTKKMMYTSPDDWRLLMSKLTRMVIDYLSSQVSHGVDAVQLFDSWVGCLSREDYHTYVSRYTKDILSSLEGRVPTIHFCANSAHLLGDFAQLGADLLSIDWRTSMRDAWSMSKGRFGIQGNLDPVLALSGGEAMRSATRRILDDSRERRGHVFSLGHGVLRETPAENLKEIVRIVHETTAVKR